ncbi:uncharacterized protein LOC113205821 [Frankliniella occidentalis]|uniref:RING-type E3 ubiquitin transferase n=1 Tax=Frankliniella occidentalis TaxID=133901 RepID=A0A9C6XVP4_FRAOC|nr:uncharacterized protein LOC113205821 [Frankliniella occidentalis]
MAATPSRHRRSSTVCEVTYLKKLDATQAACLHQRFELPVQPPVRPAWGRACSSPTEGSAARPTTASRPSRSRPPVEKCDFSQMVQERPAGGAVPREPPVTVKAPKLDAESQVRVVAPLRKTIASLRKTSTPSVEQGGGSGQPAAEEFDGKHLHPLFALLNHSMQTQTSFELDRAALGLDVDLESGVLGSLASEAPQLRPSCSSIRTTARSRAAMSVSRTASSASPRASRVDLPSTFTSRARVGGSLAKSASLMSEEPSEAKQLSTSWPEVKSHRHRDGATKTNSGTNTLPIPTAERCVSTVDNVAAVKVHASTCPGRCTPSGVPAIVVEDGVLGGQRGVVVSPVPSEAEAGGATPTAEHHNFLTVLAAGSPLGVNVMPCVSWSHVPDDLSMTDSLGFPVPDLKLQVIPYPCPCHPLDALIKSKVAEKQVSFTTSRPIVVVDEDSEGPSGRTDSSPDRLQGQPLRSDQSASSGLPEVEAVEAAAPAAVPPPLTPPEASTPPSASAALGHPPLTDKLSMRSLAAIGGQGVFQAVKESIMYSTMAAIPVTNAFVNFLPCAMERSLGNQRVEYDASEFTAEPPSPEDVPDNPKQDSERDSPCSVDSLERVRSVAVPAPAVTPVTQPEVPVTGGTSALQLDCYSPTEFTARQSSTHAKIGSIISEISADLCSLGISKASAPRLAEVSRSATGSAQSAASLKLAADGSRLILRASRRASVRSKASSPIVIIPALLPAAAPGPEPEAPPHNSPSESEQETEDDRESDTRPPSQRRKDGRPGPPLMTRRPPTRRSRDGRRGAAWRAARSQREASPRRVPDMRLSGRKAHVDNLGDKVESLWVSPWTKQTFPSSKSIIHVVGEGSRQQFKCEDPIEASCPSVAGDLVEAAVVARPLMDNCLEAPAASSSTVAVQDKQPAKKASAESLTLRGLPEGPRPPPADTSRTGLQEKADAVATAGRALIGRVMARAAATRTRPPFALRTRKQQAVAAPLEPNVEAFECKLCSDYLSPPVRQCAAGHGLCPSCLAGAESCPLCGRCVAASATADQLVRTVLFPCKNSGVGCKELYWIEDRARHEAKCPFRPRPCPCAERSQVMCPWSGLRSMIRGHMRRAHGHHGVVYPYRAFFPLEDFNRAAWVGRTSHVEIVFVEHEIFELHKVFDERNACLWGMLRHILARDANALFSYTIRFQPANMRPTVSFRNDAMAGAEDLHKALAQGKRFAMHLDCFTKHPVDLFTVQLKVQPRDRNKWP